MSGVRQAEQQLRGVWCHSLKEQSMCELLRQYNALLRGLHGPQGGTLLQQHTGGLHSFINSSSDLTKKVQPFHPCLKFINALMDAQVSAYGSHGLYCGLLSTSLLLELLLLSQHIPQATVREVADVLADIIIDHCSEPTSLLDLSNLHQMLAFLGTSLESKALGLNSVEKDHLKVVVLEAFLLSVSETGNARAFGHVVVTVVPGRPATEASVFNGLLYRHHRVQELPMSRIIVKLESPHCSQAPNYTKHSQTNEMNLSSRKQLSSAGGAFASNLQQSKIASHNPSNRIFSRYIHNTLSEPPQNRINIILFNIMLEFTNPKTECLKFKGNFSSTSVFDCEVSKQLCHFIKREGVHVLACQKVVSEGITFELERQGILVLERLGTSLTASLEKLANCRPLPDLSLLDTEPQSCTGSGHRGCGCKLSNYIGTLDSLQRKRLPGGLYLLLQNAVVQRPVVTLLLPTLSSHAVENLKVLVEETIKRASGAALSPGVVCSRCWGASLAAVLRSPDTRTALQQRTSTTEAQQSLVIDAFWRVFVRMCAHCGSSVPDEPTPLPPLPPWARTNGDQQQDNKERARQQQEQEPNQQGRRTLAQCEERRFGQHAVDVPTSSSSSSLSSSYTSTAAPAGCLLESHAAALSAISSTLETVLQLLQVDYCVFDR